MFFSDARDQSWLPDDWAVLVHQGAVVVLVSMRAGRNDAMEKAHTGVLVAGCVILGALRSSEWARSLITLRSGAS